MTPEELAKQYADKKLQQGLWAENECRETSYLDHHIAIMFGFLAGYSAAHQWVDVREKLPDNDDEVLILEAKLGDPAHYSRFLLGSYNRRLKIWESSFNDSPIEKEDGQNWWVTHWLPLPPLPTTK